MKSATNQRREHVGYSVAIFIRLAVVASQNLRIPAKFYENSNLQQFKVIQSHWPWCQSKAHIQLPISH